MASNSKTPSDPLHSLIHSLSKNEKRHFSLQANLNARKGQSKNLNLFNLVASMPVYDEEKILGSAVTGLAKNDLPAAKYKLYQLILRNLRSFHSGKSTRSVYQNQLEDIAILYRKGLFHQCNKAIEKLKGRATREENLKVLLEVTDWESQLIWAVPPKGIEERLAEIIDRKNEIIEALKREEELLGMYRVILAISKLGYTKLKPPSRQMIDKIMGSDAMLNEAPHPTRLAEMLYQLIHGLHHFIRGSYEKAYHQFLPVNAGFQDKRFLVEKYPGIFRVGVTNLLNCCIVTGRTSEFQELILQFKQVNFKDPANARRLQQLVFYLDLIYCMNFGERERGEILVEEIEVWVNKRLDEIEPDAVFNLYYNSTIFHFMHGNFRQALHHLNRIINLSRSDIRKDIKDFAVLFQLMVHYELGNLDLVEYQLRNAKRFFRLLEEEARYENRLLRYFHQLIRTKSPEEELELTQSLKSSLHEVLSQGSSRKPLGSQELLFWVEAKIQGEGLGQFFRHKVLGRSQDPG